MKLPKPVLLSLLTLVALLSASPSMAALQRVDLHNPSTATHTFLFAGDGLAAPALEFVALDLRSGLRDWSVEVFTSTVAIITGPPQAPLTGRLRLSFNALQPQAALQWAEVMFDGENFLIGGKGTRSYNGNTALWTDGPGLSATHVNFIASYFSVPPSAPVPLPAPLALILPALAFLAVVRRRGTV
jgi:hypothetical protein